MPARLRRFFGLSAPVEHGPPDDTPLAALPLLLLDTETTGLDPARDRIVSLAAIAWRGGSAEGAALDTLVDPGRPVPASATAIHGLADRDLAGLPPYAHHHPALTELMHGRVVLGHTIGFDIGVIAAETRRARLHWMPPASLCVAELAAAALPEAKRIDLDALAQRFDIIIDGRHSARGDALAAGAVFQRLLPLLGERGIRHWGEAKRAARGARGLLTIRRRGSW